MHVDCTFSHLPSFLFSSTPLALLRDRPRTERMRCDARYICAETSGYLNLSQTRFGGVRALTRLNLSGDVDTRYPSLTRLQKHTYPNVSGRCLPRCGVGYCFVPVAVLPGFPELSLWKDIKLRLWPVPSARRSVVASPPPFVTTFPVLHTHAFHPVIYHTPGISSRARKAQEKVKPGPQPHPGPRDYKPKQPNLSVWCRALA